jgi:branched-chain amino acid transport system ATP-binding protein
LRGVTAAHGDAVALREATLVVPDGRVVALLGPNGAGKTTLLSVASGLLRPRAGRVLLDRVEVTGRPPEDLVRRGVCHITEGRSVFPGLTVADNLKMFAVRGREQESVERAISAFPRLGERLPLLAGTLSGGEQQMLALARAYARQAPLVLLDEVSMGLAPLVVDEIFAFVERLAAAGSSLLLVEQYVTRALAISDFVYLLNKGRVAFAGEPGELDEQQVFEGYVGASV